MKKLQQLIFRRIYGGCKVYELRTTETGALRMYYKISEYIGRSHCQLDIMGADAQVGVFRQRYPAETRLIGRLLGLLQIRRVDIQVGYINSK
jgi:hypothetical protein